MPGPSVALLDLVTAALNPQGPSLVSNLDALAEALGAAVPSFLGFSVYAAEYTFFWGPSLTERPAPTVSPGSSLTWELPLTTTEFVKLVLFAGAPGAWVDLAADLAWLTGAPPQRLVIDRDLATPFPVEQTGPSPSSLINQALGALMARGHRPEEAVAELDAQAQAAGTDRAAAARTVLDRLDEGPTRADSPDPPP